MTSRFASAIRGLFEGAVIGSLLLAEFSLVAAATASVWRQS